MGLNEDILIKNQIIFYNGLGVVRPTYDKDVAFFFVLLASALSNGVVDKGYEVVPKALWSSLQGTS